jgi:hypothetical protein
MKRRLKDIDPRAKVVKHKNTSCEGYHYSVEVLQAKGDTLVYPSGKTRYLAEKNYRECLQEGL